MKFVGTLDGCWKPEVVTETMVPEPEVPVLHRDLDFWMTRLPPVLRSVPITRLAIPGSHDTMTYTVQKHDDVGPDEPRFIRFLGRYFSIFAKPIIFNWSVTQHDDIKAQLNGGIRYLDLRVATKPNREEIYFTHGLYGAEVNQPLQETADWLASHPDEVVLLDFQHFYKFKASHHQHLIETIHTLFKEKLCPVNPKLDHITLQWLSMKGYQVFVIYRDIAAMTQRNLWPGGLWPTPWPNTVSPEYLVKYLNDKLEKRPPESGFVSQCLLTPDASYVLRHLWGSLEKDLANVCRRVTLPWVNQQTPGKGGLNVVITDYVAHEDFMFSKTVIQRNAEFLQMGNKASPGRYIIEVQSRR